MEKTKEQKAEIQKQKRAYIELIIELLGNADERQLERLYYFMRQYLKK